MERIATRLLVPAILAALSGAALGQQEDPTESAPSLEERFQQMKQEIESLRSDNTTLRDEIDELRAETDENWLTEERAREIKNLVGEVLADADTRANLLGNGMTAGWSNGFFLASADGRFKLDISGMLQFRFIWNTHQESNDDKYRWGFEIPRAKLTFSGNVFGPDIQYLVRLDVTRTERDIIDGLEFLQDAWMRFRLTNEWSVRAGQFKVPFNREELVSSAYQLTVERSLVNENLNLGRSQGVELVYLNDYDKFSVGYFDGFTDSIGGFNLIGTNPGSGGSNEIGPDGGDNLPALSPDTEYAFAARYEHLFAGTWEQFRQFTSPIGEEFGVLLGIAGFYQQGEYGVPVANIFIDRDEATWCGVTADVSVQFGGASLFASIIYEYVDSARVPTAAINANIIGAVLEGGYYFTPKWEGFARWEYGWWRYNGNSFAALSALTIGANYYIDGQDLKWSTDIGFGISKIDPNWDSNIAGWRPEADGANPQIVIRTQLQLLF